MPNAAWAIRATRLRIAFCTLVTAAAWATPAAAQVANVSFVASREYPVAQGSSAIAVGDFNGDGKPDLTTVSASSNEVSVLMNKGDGTYLPAITYGAGSDPVAIAIGDFNGDGKLDIAVINNPVSTTVSTVSVLLGNGDGTFQNPKTTSITNGSQADSLAIGDFNGDGKLDVAVTVDLPQIGQRAVAVLLGNGDGTFQAPVNYDSGSAARYAMVADFNGDGKPDIAVSDQNANALSVLLGNGDGTFQAPVNTPTPVAAGPISVADFDHDGKPDVVMASLSLIQSFYVFLGNGNGSFAAPVVTPSSSQYSVVSVITSDLNADGLADVLAITQYGELIPFLGKGDGTFQQGTGFELSPNTSSVAIADLNGDGRADLATTDGGVNVAFGNGDGTFQVASLISVPFGPWLILTTDINGDGKTDVIVVGSDADTTGYISVLLGKGDGTFQTPITTTPFFTGYRFPPGPVVLGDLNRDGKLDLVVGFQGSGLSEIEVLIGNGDGTFKQAVSYRAGSGSIALGDFTGDGILDIVSTDGSSLYLLKGVGDGTFGFPTTIPTDPGIMVVGDFNNDGKLDVALAGSTNISILLGNGDGTFQPAKSFPLASPASSIAIGDFNKDGNLDLAVTTQVQGQVAVLLGNGDGSLQSAVYFPPGNTPVASGEPVSIVVGDLNNDGKLDLLITTQVSGNASVLLGQGDGSFQLAGIWGINGTGGSAAIGDFRGNGAPDIVAVPGLLGPNGYIDGSVSILRNRIGTPVAGLSPSALTFTGGLKGASSTSQAVMLTNTGVGALTISGIAITGADAGDFSQTNTCGPSLASQASCTISVTFTPTVTGNRTASVSITDNDNPSGSPQSIPLAGMGTDFSLAVASGGNCPAGGNCSTSAVVTAGQTATYNLQMNASSGFSSNVALSCSGAPAPSTCSVSPAVLSGTSTAFTVTISNTSGVMALLPIMPGLGGQRWLVVSCISLVVLAIAIVLAMQTLVIAQKRRQRVVISLVSLLLWSFLCAWGCGGGSNATVPPPVSPLTATITVTATADNVSRTMPLSLTINH